MSEGHKPESGAAEPRRGSADVVDLRPAAGRRSFPRPRRAILVVGMHRSGTSALTRVLSLLGADLPRELMPPVAGDNPTGFWESPRIAALHDELLAAAGSSWDDVSPLPDGWFTSDAAGAYRERLLELLERDFADSRLFVVKDPRIARLLPLWQSALRRFATEPHYVLAVRNPLEVAASLAARDGFLPAKSYLLWLSHLLESERRTRGRSRAFVLFEELLRDWRGTALRLERQLGLSWPRLSATATVEIEEFLSDRLRHHAAGAEELAGRSDAVTWVKRAYFAVLDAASGEGGALAETLDSIHAELAVADAAFAPLLANARLRLERREAELESRRREAESAADEIAARDDRLAAAERDSRRLGDEIDRQRRAGDALRAELERRQTAAAELAAELERRQTAVQALTGELERREAEARTHGEEIQRLGGELAARQERADRLGMQLSHARRAQESLRRQRREREERLSAQRRQLERLQASQEMRQREVAALAAEVRTQQVLMGLRADEIVRLRDELAGRRAAAATLAEERARLAANLDLQSERLRELDAELRATGEAMAFRDSEIARLDREVDRRERERERLELALADGATAAEALRGRLGRAEETIAELAGSLGRSRDSVGALERQVAAERSRARSLAGSRSWRLTRPLRWLAGLLRPGTRRLRQRRRRFEASGAGALFDGAYYRGQFARPDEVGPDALLHYLDRGWREGRDPHALFDTTFYLRQCPEAAGKEVALTHYFERGAAEGLDPHPLFRTAFYLEGLPAPLAAGDNPLLHFLRAGPAARSPHPLFDPAFYLRTNPDVAAAGIDPLTHYVRYGAAEGRDPHPGFDTAHYLAAQPDAAEAGTTPLEHYLAVGSERGARTRAEEGRRVLIVDHKLPAPDQDAGSLRMSHLIELLQSLGWRVTFLPHNLHDMEPYGARLRERRVEVVVRPEVESIADYLAARGDRYDLVIVCRVTVASDCFAAIRTGCRRARIVFDTIDLQHLRTLRQAELERDDELLAEAARLKRRELELARAADATWVVSHSEQELLAREAPDVDVAVVSTIHDVRGRRGGFAERRDLMFVGGFEHPPNVDAVEWLVEEILPLVHREEPELRAFLVGSKPTERVRRLASDRVTVTGYVPRLEPYFGRCRLSVAPLRYGAGIKGKVNHSLAHGVPCVLTTVAAEGMGLEHGVDAMIADGAEALAGCILAVYRDAELWRKLSDGGLENVRRRFSPPVARAALADALGRLDPDWAGEPDPA